MSTRLDIPADRQANRRTDGRTDGRNSRSVHGGGCHKLSHCHKFFLALILGCKAEMCGATAPPSLFQPIEPAKGG